MRERGKKVIWPGARVPLGEMLNLAEKDKWYGVEKTPSAARSHTLGVWYVSRIHIVLQFDIVTTP